MKSVPKVTKAERKRANQQKKLAAENSLPVETNVKQIVPEPETPDQAIYSRMAQRIVNIFIDHGFKIFGSYVREYMCERPFNADISDIDVFSVSHTPEDVKELLKGAGFRCSKPLCGGEKYNPIWDEPFKVYNFTVGMVNDFFFTGKRFSIEIDFVRAEHCSNPPFDGLDFSCNAWIWDSHGIRLSRSTGTSMDNLSPREIKHTEMEVLENAKKFITEYHPMDNEEDLLSLDKQYQYRRKARLERINKMISRGWTITNYPHLKETLLHSEEICMICQNEIENKCLKMQCCDGKYHNHCFIDYGKSELSNRTKVRCPQRCSELHF